MTARSSLDRVQTTLGFLCKPVASGGGYRVRRLLTPRGPIEGDPGPCVAGDVVAAQAIGGADAGHRAAAAVWYDS